MLATDFNLAPAGKHPASYRLFELLQMGAIPVVLHDKRGLFLPYEGTTADVRNGCGFATTFDGFLDLWDAQLKDLTDENITAMRAKILTVRDSHYTPLGAMAQLRRFIEGAGDSQTSDVRCSCRGTDHFQGAPRPIK